MGIDLQYQYRDSANARTKRRQRRRMGKLRNMCPHIDQFVVNEDDGGGSTAPHLRFAFTSPAGTHDWYCEMCGQQLSEHSYLAYRRHLQQGFQSDPSGTLQRLAADRTKANKLIEKINERGGIH